MSEQESKHTDESKQGDSVVIHGGVGPGAAIGRGSKVEAENIVEGTLIQDKSVTGATPQDLVVLLQAIKTSFGELEAHFKEEDASDAKDSLEKSIEMTQREKTPVERIKRNLETFAEIVKDTAKVSAAVAILTPQIQQAITLLSKLTLG